MNTTTNKLEIELKEITWLGSMETGWGNGYVKLPKGHPYWGKDYDDIPVEVHGGLTFGEEDENGFWVVGFDTAHHSDTRAYWTKERVEEETNNLREQLENL